MRLAKAALIQAEEAQIELKRERRRSRRESSVMVPSDNSSPVSPHTLSLVIFMLTRREAHLPRPTRSVTDPFRPPSFVAPLLRPSRRSLA